MGRSMIGGGDDASVAEVAASFPARRLGAIKNCEVLKVWNEGEEGERFLFSENSKCFKRE